MSNKQLRSLIRWVHIIGGSLIFTYIYSNTLSGILAFEIAVKAVIIPIIGLSGIVMWQQPRVMKLFKKNRSSSQSS